MGYNLYIITFVSSTRTQLPLVKRLRHRPFTAVTRVRIPYGSYGGLAQLGEHLPYKQRVGGSSPSSSTIFAYLAQLVEQLTCNQ